METYNVSATTATERYIEFTFYGPHATDGVVPDCVKKYALNTILHATDEIDGAILVELCFARLAIVCEAGVSNAHNDFIQEWRGGWHELALK